MSQNHHHDYELLRLVDQAVHDKQPTGHPLIDRLSAAVPQADAERAAVLEAALLNRLSKPEQELQPMSDFTTETKRKGQPKRRRLPMRLAAALLMLGVGVLAVLNPRLSPSGLEFGRFRTGQVEPGGSMFELYLTATAQIWQATNNPSGARHGWAGNAFDLTMTADDIPLERTHQVEALIFPDQLTATAVILSVTQQFLDLTETANGMLFFVSTPTPAAPEGGAPASMRTNRIEIPRDRLVGITQRATFADNVRLVLMVDLPVTGFTEPLNGQAALGGTPLPPLRSERSFIATSARVVTVAGDAITVEVALAEYPILRWFVESTGVQLLYVASQ